MFGRNQNRTQVCRRCSKSLFDADFEFDRAMLLLGRAYCSNCLKDFTRVCHGCRKSLCRADFETGRAVTLGSELYCDGCLEGALRTARRASVLHPSVAERLAHPSGVQAVPPPAVPKEAASPAPPAPAAAEEGTWESRRASVRFIPPLDCTVSLRRAGLKGLFGGSPVRLWVDVSEGGLRAVVEGRLAAGDAVQGVFEHPALKGKLQFRGEVRHGRPSEKFPGCTLIGVQFEAASPELRAFIRDVLGRNVALASMKPRSPHESPPPARSA